MSKWTAVKVENKELHFIVSEIVKDENDDISECILEAVINKNAYKVDWKILKNDQQWLMGWK